MVICITDVLPFIPGTHPPGKKTREGGPYVVQPNANGAGASRELGLQKVTGGPFVQLHQPAVPPKGWCKAFVGPKMKGRSINSDPKTFDYGAQVEGTLLGHGFNASSPMNWHYLPQISLIAFPFSSTVFLFRPGCRLLLVPDGCESNQTFPWPEWSCV